MTKKMSARKTSARMLAAFLMLAAMLTAGSRRGQTAAGAGDDPEARPPVSKADVRIVQRAREILKSPSVWNRADTRDCPADARTFSLYCALEKATNEVSGKFEHRGAAMQEARFVIDEIAPNRKNSTRLRPARLASYICASASSSSRSAG